MRSVSFCFSRDYLRFSRDYLYFSADYLRLSTDHLRFAGDYLWYSRDYLYFSAVYLRFSSFYSRSSAVYSRFSGDYLSSYFDSCVRFRYSRSSITILDFSRSCLRYSFFLLFRSNIFCDTSCCGSREFLLRGFLFFFAS